MIFLFLAQDTFCYTSNITSFLPSVLLPPLGRVAPPSSLPLFIIPYLPPSLLSFTTLFINVRDFPRGYDLIHLPNWPSLHMFIVLLQQLLTTLYCVTVAVSHNNTTLHAFTSISQKSRIQILPGLRAQGSTKCWPSQVIPLLPGPRMECTHMKQVQGRDVSEPKEGWIQVWFVPGCQSSPVLPS